MSSFFIRRPIFAIVISIIIVILGPYPPLLTDCPVSADFAADSQSEYDVHRR